MHKAFKQLPGILGLTLLIVGAGALTAHAEIPLSVVPADNSILFRGGASTITDTFDLHIFTDDRMYLDASTINVAGDINMVPGKLLSLKDGSNIYDNYDMHIATDDRLFLDAPESVNVAGNLNMLQGKTLTLKTGSTISDDMNLHIATDDNMYLDAPTRVYVQNNLNVGGNIAVTGHVISNVTGNLTGNVTGNVTGNISGGTVGGNGASLTNIDGAHIQNGTITSNKLAFSLPGDIALTTADNDFTGTNTFEGDITMDAPDRHATLTLANDGDLNVTGHTTLGSSHWDDLTVNATAEFNNDLTVDGASTLNDGLTVTSGDTSLQGLTATTVHGTDAATFDSDATFNGDVYLTRILSSNCGEGCEPVTIGYHSNQQGFKVWGDSDLRGSLTIGGWGSDNNGLIVNGDDGIIMNAASRHALLDLQNDGDINVEGNSTLGSSHWDTLTVNATAEFNNDLTVDGASTLNDGLTVTSGAAALQGLTATTIHGTDAATFDSTLTTADDITMNAASRHATLTLANDGDLNVTGHTTLGSSSWDDLTVNATSDFGSDVTVSSGNVHVQDGNLNVDNGNTANLNGDVNLGTDSGNDIIVNGRLYGFDGDPLTIGHNSDNSGLKVWGDSDLRGSLTVGGWGSDNTGIDVQSGDITLDDGNLNVNDGTIYASSGLTVAGGSTSLQGTTTTSLHATGAATLDNGLTVTSGATSLQGLTAGNTTVNNLTVNGAATYNGTTTFAGGQTFNSTNVFGGTATFNSTTTHNGAANFTSTATFGSTVTATAGVDFSGASSLRVPVTAAALVDNTTACATTGLVTFSTNDSHFYGCDGSKWQIFDN